MGSRHIIQDMSGTGSRHMVYRCIMHRGHETAKDDIVFHGVWPPAV